MKIAIFTKNIEGIYSGGRYLSLIMGYALAHAGHKVEYYTNIVPAFNRDFETLNRRSPIKIITQDMWPVHGDPSIDWAIIVPSGGLAEDFYAPALNFAARSGARKAVLSFETANWFNEYVSAPRSPLPWEAWARIVQDGGLVLTIAKEGVKYAKEFYGDLIPDAPLVFDYWHPAINDDAAEAIGWREAPRYRNRVACFIRTSDAHKGAADLLAFPAAFFKDKTLCLVFGRGVDAEYVAALTKKLAPVPGAQIMTFDRISDEEKFAILASSSVLLFPSYFEGFGYPPVEAAFVGTPTVAYDLPVLRETLGAGAEFAPPGDVAEMARKADLLAKQTQPKKPIEINARCSIEDAGKALAASLARADAELAKKQSPLIAPSTPRWKNPADFTGWCLAERKPKNRIAVLGAVCSSIPDQPFAVRVNGVEVASGQSGEAANSSGIVSFQAEIPEGTGRLSGNIVSLDAVAHGETVWSLTAPVTSTPALDLAAWSLDNQNHLPDRDVVAVRIEDEDFGLNASTLLHFACLAIDFVAANFSLVLRCPYSVAERLAASGRFDCLFADVRTDDEDSSLFQYFAEVTLCNAALGGDTAVVATRVETQDERLALEITIDSDALITAGKEDGRFAVQMAVDRLLSKRPIIFRNALREDELAPAAVAFLYALDDIAPWSENYQIVLAEENLTASELLEPASQPFAVEKRDLLEVLLDSAFEKAPVVEFDASDRKCSGSYEPGFNGLSSPVRPAQFPDFSAAARELVTQIADKHADLQTDHFASLIDSAVGKSVFSGRLDDERIRALKRARSRTRRLHRAPAILPPAISPPLSSKNAIFSAHSHKFPLASLFLSNRRRKIGSHLEIDFKNPVYCDFRCPEKADRVTVEILYRLVSNRKAFADLSLRLDGKPVEPAAGEQTNQYRQLVRSIALSDSRLPGAGDQHRLEISLNGAEKGDTLCVHAVSIIPETAGSDEEHFSIVHFEENKWKPAEMPAPTPMDVAEFVFDANSVRSIPAMGKGWGDIQPDFRWTVGKSAQLIVPFTDGLKDEAVLFVSAQALLRPGEITATMIVQIGGTELGVLEFGGALEEKQLAIPEHISRQGFGRVEFIITDPKSPASLRMSTDPRELGFAIRQVKILTKTKTSAKEQSNTMANKIWQKVRQV